MLECQRKIEEMDEKLKKLESDNLLLATQKSHEELEKLQLKKQSFSLALRNTTSSSDVQTDTSGLVVKDGSDTTTCDTFHTANSDCSFASALPSPFPPRDSSLLLTPVPSVTSTIEEEEIPVDDEDLSLANNNQVMSDSGVCLDGLAKLADQQPAASALSREISIPLAVNRLLRYDEDNLSTSSSQAFYDHLFSSQMQKLNTKIASKKAEIMKVLELGGDKRALDEMINGLQDLQKDYIKLEIKMENGRGKFKHSNYLSDIFLNIVLFFNRWLHFGW